MTIKCWCILQLRINARTDQPHIFLHNKCDFRWETRLIVTFQQITIWNQLSMPTGYIKLRLCLGHSYNSDMFNQGTYFALINRDEYPTEYWISPKMIFPITWTLSENRGRSIGELMAGDKTLSGRNGFTDNSITMQFVISFAPPKTSPKESWFLVRYTQRVIYESHV